MKAILLWLSMTLSILGQGLTVGTNYISLNQKTNRLSDSGTFLTYNGNPFGATVFNAGAYIPMEGVFFTNVCTVLNGPVTNDFFTVPAGYYGANVDFLYDNAVASSTTNQAKVKVSGSYYPLIVQSAGSTSNFVATPTTRGYMLMENDTCSWVLSTTASVGISATMTCVPTNSNLVVRRLLSFTGGSTPDLLYEVPANKVLLSIAFTSFPSLSPSSLFINGSSASVTLGVYVVPSGSSVGDADNLTTFSTVNTNVSTSTTLSPLTAGQKVYLSSSSSNAGQIGILTGILVNQ